MLEASDVECGPRARAARGPLPRRGACPAGRRGVSSAQRADLDVEGWRRLALAVATLDDVGLRAALGDAAPRVPVAAQVESGFLGLARDTAPLTVALVRQSAIRAEEFARHFAMRLGVGIVGRDQRAVARRVCMPWTTNGS